MKFLYDIKNPLKRLFQGIFNFILGQLILLNQCVQLNLTLC